MKSFLAFFISFAYAAEFLESGDRIIEKVPESEFDQLSFETFHRIMVFLNPNSVLSLRILNLKTYRRVRRLWPEMELSTTVNHLSLTRSRSIDFSHIVDIFACGSDEVLAYTQAELKYLRKLSVYGIHTRDSQNLIDLLPRKSLTSLNLEISKSEHPLISKIDFSMLSYLKLTGPGIRLSSTTFSSLPNCMECLEVEKVFIDDETSFWLATALGTMDKLKVLSLHLTLITPKGLSVILENLPASLKKLDISHLRSSVYPFKLSEHSLQRLREMKFLQEINVCNVDIGFETEIISNLPKCIIIIESSMGRETFDVL